ncbi:MAG TPA: hypothetical protein ENI26_07720 [Methylophaga aminisulfidivorans]|uniref:Uncharacterized protein n=2 Tax=root TaxID=1 RepID=A0A7C1ZRZ4_9GAMM|nr:hypothetical protein [Methylophaga sp.]HEC74245.1 hypothetical protein [Methylophaga aminisulfidivorans]
MAISATGQTPKLSVDEYLSVKSAQMTNRKAKLDGYNALQLINSVPAPTATQGNNINIKV